MIVLYLVATNRYVEFLPALFRGLDQFFFADHDVRIVLFTNQSVAERPRRLPLDIIPCPGFRFPYATLYRYQLIETERLNADVCFYMDVDFSVRAPIDDSVVPNGVTDCGLVAVRHPGFFLGGGSWEDRPESRAYTPVERRRTYYAGGFQGGLATQFFEAVSALRHGIDVDDQQGIMAVWHDESHWNAYLSDHQPLVLSPEYCYPGNSDQARQWGLAGLEPRLVALDKDHAILRGS